MKFKCPSCGDTKREVALADSERSIFTDEELSNDECIDVFPCVDCEKKKRSDRLIIIA